MVGYRVSTNHGYDTFLYRAQIEEVEEIEFETPSPDKSSITEVRKPCF